MIKLRLINKNGKKLAIFAFSDIDGTINDQRLPEKDRIKSIDQAKKAIDIIQDHDIPVGLITARSFGETLIYKKAIHTLGFIISEDGAIIILPKLEKSRIKFLSQNYHILTHENESALILSKVEIKEIRKFFKFINDNLKNKFQDELITSCTNQLELLKKLINYETLEDAKRATDRLASAFVRDSTKEQFELLKKYAPEWNLRVEGEQFHAHIVGKDADKGSALKFINDHISNFFPDENLDGIFPIVIGNDYNDLRLFEEANKMGGISVIVRDSDNEFKVSEKLIPTYVFKSKSPNGSGLLESVEFLLKKLN